LPCSVVQFSAAAAASAGFDYAAGFPVADLSVDAQPVTHVLDVYDKKSIQNCFIVKPYLRVTY